MADAPEIVQAKAKLRELVVPAVETLEELMSSDHAGIRLGASKEVLDRGGVPARHDHNVSVDLTVDEEIEELLRDVRRQVEKRNAPGIDIEDAVVIEDQIVVELPVGEQVAVTIGVPRDDQPVEAEVVEPESAWWQARPNDE